MKTVDISFGYLIINLSGYCYLFNSGLLFCCWDQKRFYRYNNDESDTRQPVANKIPYHPPQCQTRFKIE